MRKKQLLRVLEAATFIAARRCDIFVEPYTCITEDDGTGPWKPCDPCALAAAGVPVVTDLAGYSAWAAQRSMHIGPVAIGEPTKASP